MEAQKLVNNANMDAEFETASKDELVKYTSFGWVNYNDEKIFERNNDAFSKNHTKFKDLNITKNTFCVRSLPSQSSAGQSTLIPLVCAAVVKAHGGKK